MLESIVRRYLYYPVRLEPEARPPPWVRGAREVYFTSAPGDRLHGLHWPAEAGRPTLLYLHGNAQHVFDWALVREDLAPLRSGLLLIDYPGYGKSTGQPSEAGLYAAGRAALRYLAEDVGVEAGRVVVLGKSLGGGVATLLAAEHELLGVILESTFRSIPAVIRRLMPIAPVGGLLRSERYDSLGRMGSLRAPLLVVHGTQDELIAVEEGLALYEVAREPKALYLVEGAGHNNVADVARAAYGQRLAAWLAEHPPKSRL